MTRHLSSTIGRWGPYASAIFRARSCRGLTVWKQAIADYLGIGIFPRLAISRLKARAGLVVILLSASPTASPLTLLYRDHDGRPDAAEDFVELVRRTGEDRVWRKAAIALRAAR